MVPCGFTRLFAFSENNVKFNTLWYRVVVPGAGLGTWDSKYTGGYTGIYNVFFMEWYIAKVELTHVAGRE